MLSSNTCFPYPVLRPIIEDYKTTVFKDEHTIQAGNDCFHIRTNFSVNNTEISQMIRSGALSFALYIYCQTTMFRKLEYVSAITDYRLAAGDVHHSVEVTPCIVALQDIPEFHIEDFDIDYDGIMFNIEQGDIIGIGNKHLFDANYADDIIKEGSPIIDIEASDENYLKLVFESPHIIARLPREQCTNYWNCNGSVEKYALLHSVITIPALTQAITIIARDDMHPTFSEYAWFVTINLQLKKMARTDAEYQNLLEHPVTTAEKIMANNSSASLLAINNMNV